MWPLNWDRSGADLRRGRTVVWERAGDADTVSTARDIAAEEREMARRLEDGFDAAVAASLRDQNPDDLDEQLNSYLADTQAIEKQVISLLQAAPKIVAESRVADLFEQHLDETREHERRVRERLEARGSSPSRIKDVGMRLAGLGQGGFFATQPDTPAKMTGSPSRRWACAWPSAGTRSSTRREAQGVAGSRP
jgi:ferritin-like metal-binding protein YciE